MSKIIDYYIITSSKTDTLRDSVKRALEAKWQPFGSPMVIFSQFHQTMVMYEHDEKLSTGNWQKANPMNFNKDDQKKASK